MTLKMALISMFTLGLAVVAQAQTPTTLIVRPSVNSVNFSANSDETGVCRALGYRSAAVGAEVVTDENVGPVITVDANGSIIGGDVVMNRSGKWVLEVVCIDQVAMPTLTPIIIYQPTNPGSGILFSSKSDVDGICYLENYTKAVPNTTYYSNMAVGSVLIVDKHGNVTGGDTVTQFQGQWISALICQ